MPSGVLVLVLWVNPRYSHDSDGFRLRHGRGGGSVWDNETADHGPGKQGVQQSWPPDVRGIFSGTAVLVIGGCKEDNIRIVLRLQLPTDSWVTGYKCLFLRGTESGSITVDAEPRVRATHRKLNNFNYGGCTYG